MVAVHGLVQAELVTGGGVLGDWKRYASRTPRPHWPHRRQFWTGGGSTRSVNGPGLNRIVRYIPTDKAILSRPTTETTHRQTAATGWSASARYHRANSPPRAVGYPAAMAAVTDDTTFVRSVPHDLTQQLHLPWSATADQDCTVGESVPVAVPAVTKPGRPLHHPPRLRRHSA